MIICDTILVLLIALHLVLAVYYLPSDRGTLETIEWQKAEREKHNAEIVKLEKRVAELKAQVAAKETREEED